MPPQDDIASKLALLQADVEQLRLEIDGQKRVQATTDVKVAALTGSLVEARYAAEALDKKLTELRLSTDRSLSLLKTIEPEKLALELSRLSDAVTRLRDSMQRHEAEGKQLV
jgi:chromosome segregation ATPase